MMEYAMRVTLIDVLVSRYIYVPCATVVLIIHLYVAVGLLAGR